MYCFIAKFKLVRIANSKLDIITCKNRLKLTGIVKKQTRQNEFWCTQKHKIVLKISLTEPNIIYDYVTCILVILGMAKDDIPWPW